MAKTTVDAWVVRGCPCVKKGSRGKAAEYDTVAVYGWLSGVDDDLDLSKERAKLTKKQTEKTKIQIEQLKETLVDAEEMQEVWVKYISACRVKLLALPTKMASEMLTVDGLQDAQNKIKIHVNEALDELANV